MIPHLLVDILAWFGVVFVVIELPLIGFLIWYLARDKAATMREAKPRDLDVPPQYR